MDDPILLTRQPARVLRHVPNLILLVPLAKLDELWPNPFKEDSWLHAGDVGSKEFYNLVRVAYEEEHQDPGIFCTVTRDAKEHWPALKHAQRIAALARKGWRKPIDVDVWLDGNWTLLDGNHRLGAARFLDHEMVKIIAGGSIDVMEEFFDMEIVCSTAN